MVENSPWILYTESIFQRKEVLRMNLGNHLFQARKRRGLSQEAAAEKLGVSRQTISKIGRASCRERV